MDSEIQSLFRHQKNSFRCVNKLNDKGNCRLRIEHIGRLVAVTYISAGIYEYYCIQMKYFRLLILSVHNMWKCLIRLTKNFRFEFTQRRHNSSIFSFFSTVPTGIQAVDYASISIREAKSFHVKAHDEKESISSWNLCFANLFLPFPPPPPRLIRRPLWQRRHLSSSLVIT
jgi:hypothetical protein